MMLALRMSHSVFVASGVLLLVCGLLELSSSFLHLLCVPVAWVALTSFGDVGCSWPWEAWGFIIIYNLRRLPVSFIFASAAFL